MPWFCSSMSTKAARNGEIPRRSAGSTICVLSEEKKSESQSLWDVTEGDSAVAEYLLSGVLAFFGLMPCLLEIF